MGKINKKTRGHSLFFSSIRAATGTSIVKGGGKEGEVVGVCHYILGYDATR